MLMGQTVCLVCKSDIKEVHDDASDPLFYEHSSIVLWNNELDMSSNL